MKKENIDLLRQIARFPDSRQYRAFNITGFKVTVNNWSKRAKKLLLEEGHEVEEVLDSARYCEKCGTEMEENPEDSSEDYCPTCNYGYRRKGRGAR